MSKNLPGPVSHEPRHSVRVVALRTEISPHVLRAWERRYGAVSPRRSAGRQRLYSDADIERLRWLSRAVRAGRRIGDVVNLAADELIRIVEQDESLPIAAPDRGTTSRIDASKSGERIEPLLRLAAELQGDKLELLLRRASTRMGAAAFMEEVASPLLVRIGESWHAGEITTAHEHMATSVVRRVVERILTSAPAESYAPTFVAATPSGHAHELGAMLAAATAATEGWRVIYLGADLPAADVARASEQTNARVVGISAVSTEDERTLAKEMKELRRRLASRVALWIGGNGAGLLRGRLDGDGIEIIEDLSALRVRLRASMVS